MCEMKKIVPVNFYLILCSHARKRCRWCFSRTPHRQPILSSFFLLSHLFGADLSAVEAFTAAGVATRQSPADALGASSSMAEGALT